ncbi:ATP-binding protein [Candidatus Micrarchaeota archaeon]|nr:ATP-binding protein [Candidatus Micrarchaeota archaeon]
MPRKSARGSPRNQRVQVQTAEASDSHQAKTSAKPKGFKPIKQIKSTEEIAISDKLIDQVVGQERGIEIIRKASKQKRNVLLVGTPGTGKSMLAQAMAELMPIEDLQDIMIIANRDNENQPKVRIVKAGEGKKIIAKEKISGRLAGSHTNLFLIAFMIFSVFIALYFLPNYFDTVIVAAMLIGLFLMGAAMMFAMQLSRGRLVEADTAKLAVDNGKMKKAPFVDATGSRAGALLGDVKHDPFQSLPPEQTLTGTSQRINMESAWFEMAAKYPNRIEKRSNGYEAIRLPRKEKVYVLGMKNGRTVKSRVWSLNRRRYKGKISEIKTRGRRVRTTPEHAFLLAGKDAPARTLKKGEWLQSLNES